MKQHLVLFSFFSTFLHGVFGRFPKNIWARDERVIALELFISGHDFDSKTDERVGGEKRNVQSLKSGMKILEIAQWDTWFRSFWEIVSIFLIFGSGGHCHLSFLDQRFLCLMLSIYFNRAKMRRNHWPEEIWLKNAQHIILVNMSIIRFLWSPVSAHFDSFINFMNNIISSQYILWQYFQDKFLIHFREKKTVLEREKNQ